MSLSFIAFYRKVIAVTWLVILVFHVSTTKETSKPGALGTFCYDAFVAAWRHCCGNKYPGCVQGAMDSVKQIMRGRRKRDVDEESPFEPGWKAKRFFSRRYPRSSFLTGATEECCHEQCSLQEIAEYSCF